MTQVEFKKLILSNGLEVIIHQDHSLPIVAVNVWYHVGSKNERVGRTGFAHLFEHMMFEGSKNHNSSHFEPLQKIGASLNGSTNSDATNYWEDVPSNGLDLALWLESDRMGFLLDTVDQKRLDIQRDVVKNERRQSYENVPYGKSHLEILPLLFPLPHPYNWPTIGYQEDLEAASISDIHDFFKKFYSPSNASLAIVGDVDLKQTEELVNVYFGDLPSVNKPDLMKRFDSPLNSNIQAEIFDKVQFPRVYITWPAAPIFTQEEASLEILSNILGSGRSSILHRDLVYDKKISSSISCWNYGQEIASEFGIQSTISSGSNIQENIDEIQKKLEFIASGGLNEKDLIRVKNLMETEFFTDLQNFGGFNGRADQLNYFNVMAGDPSCINSDFNRYINVTLEDVKKVAEDLLDSPRVELSVLNEKEFKSSKSTSIDRTQMPKSEGIKKFIPEIPQLKKLESEVGLLLAKRKFSEIVSIATVIKDGSNSETGGVFGLSNLIGKMLSEGTVSRSSKEISDQIEFLGAGLNVNVGREHITISTEVAKPRWGDVFDIMSDIVMNPKFSDDELVRIKDLELTKIRRAEENPSFVASRIVRGILFKDFEGLANPIFGDKSTLETISTEHLRSRYQEILYPQNISLLFVGDIDGGQIDSKCKWNLQESPRSSSHMDLSYEDLDLNKTKIFLIDKPDAPQSVIRIGIPTISRNHEDFFSLTLVNFILGGQFISRLNMNLRDDKGYTYGYSSNIDWSFLAPSLIYIGGAVETKVTSQAIFETLKEIDDIKNNRLISEKEFFDAKQSINKGFSSGFATNDQIIQKLHNISLFGLQEDYYVNFLDKFNSLSLEDIQKSALKYIDHSSIPIVIVGDVKKIKKDLQSIGYDIEHLDNQGNFL